MEQGLPAPALPAPLLLPAGSPRQSSAAGTLAQDGAAYDSSLSSSLVGVDGTDLQYSPNYDPGNGGLEPAWAVFNLDLTGSSPDPELRLIWTTAPAAGSAWLGIANFGTNRWDWQSAPVDGGPVDFGSLQFYKNASSNHLYVVVLLTGTDGANLHRVRLGQALVEGEAPMPELSEGIGSLLAQPQQAGYGVPGSVGLFDYDWDGDGTFDDTDRAENDPPQYSYGAGDSNGILRYHNDEGYDDQLAFSVHVLDNWDVYDVDGEIGVVEIDRPRLAVIDGYLGLLYRQKVVAGNVVSLVYRSIDPANQDWGAETIIGISGNPFNLTDLLAVDGAPAFCYNTTEEVWFSRASSAAGDDWIGAVKCESVPVMGGLLSECNMALINGNPAWAVRVQASGEVWYERAVDSNGSDWTGGMGFAFNGAGNKELTLGEVGGLPAIAYCTGLGYRVAQADNENGQGLWTNELLDFGTMAPFSVDMSTIDGLPCALIPFNADNTYTYPTLRQAPNADGSGVWTSIYLGPTDPGVYNGQYCDLVVLDPRWVYTGMAAFLNGVGNDLGVCFFRTVPSHEEFYSHVVLDDGLTDCQSAMFGSTPVVAFTTDSKTLQIAVMH
ncbi:hypothetical protein KDL29_15940 [bacterium]|nr:hypothetical protein [bacterium]